MKRITNEVKSYRFRKITVVIGMIITFFAGAVSFPVANAATQYVSMQQRNKDLRDIATQFVALQRRVSDLEFCVRNLRANKFSSFGEVSC